jgi:hypothetical protein
MHSELVEFRVLVAMLLNVKHASGENNPPEAVTMVPAIGNKEGSAGLKA